MIGIKFAITTSGRQNDEREKEKESLIVVSFLCFLFPGPVQGCQKACLAFIVSQIKLYLKI